MNIQTLVDAVQSGGLARVRAILAERPDLIAKDVSESDERRALHFAVLRRDEPMVRLLMESGANPRKGVYPHRDATSPLALARDREYHELIPILESESPQPHPEPEPPGPLQSAIQHGDLARVRQLLDADPTLLHQLTHNGGPLTTAAIHNQLEIATLLLDRGADPDERILLSELETPTPSWGFPLWHAAAEGHYQMCRLLLDRGADPNGNVYASGWPLRNAWDHEDDAIKRLLLERGAKLQPYMVAENHDVAEAERMLAAGYGEALARELAVSAADYGCLEILNLALQRLRWPRSDPRWHWVIIQPIRGAGAEAAGQFACMNALLRFGVDPNVTRFGQTALHYTAARHGGLSEPDRARFAAMLIDAGARLDLRDEMLQSTPLGWACRWGRPQLGTLLIERGAPVHEPDAETWATPTAWATKKQQAELLALLDQRA